jgi:hypothetical protein
MEPLLHKGDLAIVRAAPSYHVGDVVAYHSSTLRTVVLHRIIGRDGDRYVFKGDNNTWVDTDHPEGSALIGRMEMKLPGVGTHVQQIASPLGVGAMAAVAVFPVASKRRRRRDERRMTDQPKRPRGQPLWRHFDPRLLAAMVVGVAALAFAFTKSPTIHTTSDMPFDDHGEFSYSGAAPGGSAVYQTDKVSSGQPIFFNLVDTIEVDFKYYASSSAPVIARGDLALSAEVSDADGWTYPIPLAPPAHFEASEAHSSATLNLRDLRATLTDMETATGVKHDAYTVLIKASVNREVRRSDAVVAGVFAPNLEFRLDSTQMHLAAPGGNALTPSQGGLLSLPRTTANHIDIFGQSLSIAAFRAAALAFFVVIAALVLDTLLRTAKADETSLIERRYKNYLLPIRSAELTAGLVIDVDSITALARVADHAGAPMLQGGAGAYHVVDGTRVYRYRVPVIDSGPVIDANPVERDDAPPMPHSTRRERPLRARPRVDS